jgi:hypothetical protein
LEARLGRRVDVVRVREQMNPLLCHGLSGTDFV